MDRHRVHNLHGYLPDDGLCARGGVDGDIDVVFYLNWFFGTAETRRRLGRKCVAFQGIELGLAGRLVLAIILVIAAIATWRGVAKALSRVEITA